MLRYLTLLLASFPALATDTAAPGVSASSYVQAGLALCLIIGLLLGTTWLARKVSGGKIFGQGGMKVIGGVALGPRERLVLIEVGDTWLVIGIVPGQIRTLHSLPKGAPAADHLAEHADAPFATWLKSITDRRIND